MAEKAEITLEQEEWINLRAELKCRRYEIMASMREEKRRLRIIESEIKKIDAWLGNPEEEIIVC